MLANGLADEESRTVHLGLGRGEICALKLARARADGASDSVPVLFDEIFRYAETQDGRDPVWGYLGPRHRKSLGLGLSLAIVKALRVEDVFRRGTHFVVC